MERHRKVFNLHISRLFVWGQNAGTRTIRQIQLDRSAIFDRAWIFNTIFCCLSGRLRLSSRLSSRFFLRLTFFRCFWRHIYVSRWVFSREIHFYDINTSANRNLTRLRHRRKHVHYILVPRSFWSRFVARVARVWVWFCICRLVTMTTCREQGIFKMAVARTRAMVSESFDSFVVPVINKPVPNHLLETSKHIQKQNWVIKIFLERVIFVISVVIFWYCFVFVEIYAKVGQNSILQARPSVVHFAGFQVGEKITRTLVSAIVWMDCSVFYKLNSRS